MTQNYKKNEFEYLVGSGAFQKQAPR